MGSRMLRRWLNRPLRCLNTLQSRQAALQWLISDYRFEQLSPALKQIGDIERVLARVALRSARPRDLERLKNAFLVLPALQEQLDTAQPTLLKKSCNNRQHLSRA